MRQLVTMAAKAKKQYASIQKKYKLPSFEELDSEFEIGSIESEDYMLREIRKRFGEKIRDVCGFVGEVLHPESNLADLYESRVFEEHEKAELFELYKKLMVADRTVAELTIQNEEKLDAEFIRDFSREWEKMKPQLVKFIRRLRESWEKDTDQGEAAGYMG